MLLKFCPTIHSPKEFGGQAAPRPMMLSSLGGRLSMGREERVVQRTRLGLLADVCEPQEEGGELRQDHGSCNWKRFCGSQEEAGLCGRFEVWCAQEGLRLL